VLILILKTSFSKLNKHKDIDIIYEKEQNYTMKVLTNSNFK